jgi:hypothetical protein
LRGFWHATRARRNLLLSGILDRAVLGDHARDEGYALPDDRDGAHTSRTQSAGGSEVLADVSIRSSHEQNSLAAERKLALSSTHRSIATHNDSIVMRNHARLQRGRASVKHNDAAGQRDAPRAIRNDPRATRNDARAMRNDPRTTRNDPRATRNDAGATRDSPRGE